MNNHASLPLSEALRLLPVYEPPAGGWAGITRRLDARRRQRRLAAGLAAAASLLLVLALPQWRGADQSAAPSAIAAVNDLQRLRSDSAELETELSRLREQASVWDGETASTVAWLQRNVALVDVQLNEYAAADPAAVESPGGGGRPDGLHSLWRKRVDLLQALVREHQGPALIRENLSGAEGADSLEI